MEFIIFSGTVHSLWILVLQGEMVSLWTGEFCVNSEAEEILQKDLNGHLSWWHHWVPFILEVVDQLLGYFLVYVIFTSEAYKPCPVRSEVGGKAEKCCQAPSQSISGKVLPLCSYILPQSLRSSWWKKSDCTWGFYKIKIYKSYEIIYIVKQKFYWALLWIYGLCKCNVFSPSCTI